MLVPDADAMPEDELAAFPAAVDEDQDDDRRQINADLRNGVVIVEPKKEVHQLQNHGGDVGEHMLDRVARTPNAVVAHEIGETGNRSRGRHNQTDREQITRRRRPACVMIVEEDDIGDQRADETDDRKWDQHRVNRVAADLGGASGMSTARVRPVHRCSPPAEAPTHRRCVRFP